MPGYGPQNCGTELSLVSLRAGEFWRSVRVAMFGLESRSQHYDALADSKCLKPSCQQPHVRSLVSSEYLCHVYVRSDSLAGVVIADSEYPSRVAFTLLEKVSVLWTRLGWQV